LPFPPRAQEPATSPKPAVKPAGRVVRVGARPEGIAVDGRTGTAAIATAAGLTLVDAATGAVRREVALPAPARHLSFAGGRFLVPLEDADQLAEVTPTGRVRLTPAGGHPVTTLDWQSFAFGNGATDVAYFLSGAISPELRRAHEAEFLDRYLAGLKAHGVADYSRADLARDYGRGGFLLFMTAFFAAMVVKQTPRGDDMFMQMMGGASQHILDSEALATLG